MKTDVVANMMLVAISVEIDSKELNMTIDPAAIDYDDLARQLRAQPCTPIEVDAADAVEALRERVAALEKAITRNAEDTGRMVVVHDRAVKDAEVRAEALAGALEAAAKFMEDLRGPDVITHTSLLHAEAARAALAATPATVLERARAMDLLEKAVRGPWQHDGPNLALITEALAKLDAR